MSNTFDGAIFVVATGVSQATSGSSAGGALPNAQSGEVPRYVRVSASLAAYFRMGAGAQTCVSTDLMIVPGDAVILAVPRGFTNFACLQVAAAGVVQVSPLENM